MAKTVSVVLAGKTYEVAELRARPNAEWRAAALGLADDLVGFLQLPGEKFTPGVMAAIVGQVKGLLLGSPGELLRLLGEYCPEIAAERERIEGEGYDSEVAAAFGEVLRLAFPFASVLKQVAGLTSGWTRRPTGRSLPGPSGESGTTS